VFHGFFMSNWIAGMSPLDQQAGAAYVKLAEWLENALTARENRHLQSAAEAEKWADLPACGCI
jgi:hypothetical protein